RRAAREIDHVLVLPTVDLPLSDPIHIDSAGNRTLARRAADLALGEVFGQDRPGRFPDARTARRTGKTSITVTFDHIQEALFYGVDDPGRLPFAVRDKEGPIPLTGWSLPAADAIELILARAAGPGATVTGLPGALPPADQPPFDVDGNRPMLGFTLDVSGSA
ncbi:MAG: hypothetical protein R3336_10515, partial [Phycisphaeraceae bacterium]|nr:hypothetical protein [Phycisphaeraceae bacterium]